MFSEITIIGNLGQDPELRYLPNGDPVTNLSIATSRKWTGQDGQPAEQTTWYRITVWGKQAEPCNQYLAKGRQVFVKGELTPDKDTGGPRLWTAQDGSVRASFEVRAHQVKFLGNRADNQAQPAPQPQQAQPQAQPQTIDTDDVPF